MSLDSDHVYECENFIRKVPNFPIPDMTFIDLGPLLANPKALNELVDAMLS